MPKPGKEEFVPCIFLSEACEVTDMTDGVINDHKKLSVGALLMKSISKTDGERLKRFCAEKNEDTESILISMRFCKYRYGAAVSERRGGVKTVKLYLLHSRVQLQDIKTLSERMTPLYIRTLMTSAKEHSGYDSTASASLSSLVFSEDKIEAHELDELVRSLCAKLSKGNSHVGSKMEFTANNVGVKSVREKCGSVKLGAFILIFTAIAEVLDSAGTDGIIKVSNSRFSDSTETVMSIKYNGASPFVGVTSDILSLSSFIPRSTLRLSLAAECAAQCGLNLSCGYDASAESLSFFIGCMKDSKAILEFKYRDREENSNRFFDIASALIEQLPE